MSNENFCAVVANGKVENLIVVEPGSPVLAKHPEWVFLGENPQGVSVGWSYNGSVFTPPPAPPPPPRIITKLAFRYRLTDAEYVGILNAAKTDVEVAAWIETFNMVSQVNLDDPRTKSGLDMMVSKNLLTAQRETQILTAPVQGNEVP